MLALLLSLQPPNGIDTFGLIFISVIGLVFLCTSAAATLLLLKKKSAIVLCWICVPLLVMNFPIGTIIAFYVAIQIGKPEIREYLN